MAEQPVGQREVMLRFPVFAIVTDDGEEHDGLIIVEVNGQECLPLFLSREVAELYGEQARDAGGSADLVLREHGGDKELGHLLDQLPASVGHVVWDITLWPRAIRMTAVGDLRRALTKGA